MRHTQPLSPSMTRIAVCTLAALALLSRLRRQAGRPGRRARRQPPAA